MQIPLQECQHLTHSLYSRNYLFPQESTFAKGRESKFRKNEKKLKNVGKSDPFASAKRKANGKILARSLRIWKKGEREKLKNGSQEFHHVWASTNRERISIVVQTRNRDLVMSTVKRIRLKKNLFLLLGESLFTSRTALKDKTLLKEGFCLASWWPENNLSFGRGRNLHNYKCITNLTNKVIRKRVSN